MVDNNLASNVHEYAETDHTSNLTKSLSMYAQEYTNTSSDYNASNRSYPLQIGNGREPDHIMAHVERYAVPVICILGLVGNTLSFIVFLRKTLRRNSCNLFLAARSLSDNGFIIILFIIWLSSTLDLRLSQAEGICQTIIFLSYVFGCVSVWLVVFVTVENYIRICKPFLVNGVCKSTNAKAAVSILLVFVISCYNFPLWTTSNRCIPYKKYLNFIQAMVYTDTILTLVLPTLIMTFLMGAMARSSVSACKRRRRLRFGKIQNTRNPMTKVTTMLLAVTLIFFTLNMPSHVVRLRLMIITLSNNQTRVTTSTELIIQSIAQLLYYLSLAVNIIVYFLFGSNFRRTFFGLFAGRRSSVSVQTDNSVLSNYHRNKANKSHSMIYSYTFSSNDSTYILKVNGEEDQEMTETTIHKPEFTIDADTDLQKEEVSSVVNECGISMDNYALIDEPFIYPLRRFRSSDI